MASAMPCKTQPTITKVVAQPEIASEKKCKTVHGCTVESHESTRQQAKSSQSKHHEDHTASKRIYFDVALQLGTQVHPDATSDENAKAAVDQEWKKLETIPAWNVEKVTSKKEATLPH